MAQKNIAADDVATTEQGIERVKRILGEDSSTAVEMRDYSSGAGQLDVAIGPHESESEGYLATIQECTDENNDPILAIEVTDIPERNEVIEFTFPLEEIGLTDED